MSNHQQHGGLDRAIDHAVREMMQRDARPGLSRRVLRRIEGGTAPAGGGAAWRWIRAAALPAAAVAVVVLAALGMLRTPETQPPPAQAAAQPAAAPVASGTAPAAPEPVRERAPLRPRADARPESIFGSRTDRVRATDIGAAEAPRPAAEPSDPQAAPPGYAPITIPAIQIAPIEIAPVMVPRVPQRR